jgi:hypothetical protein
MTATVKLHEVYAETTMITAQMVSGPKEMAQGFLIVRAMAGKDCSHINIQLYADEDCCNVYFNEVVMVPCQDLPDYRMIRLAITVMDALIARLEIGWPDSLPELVQRAMKAIEKAQAQS